MITEVRLKNFTAFDDLELKCSPGINVFIGENGTGKTHLLEVIYAACDYYAPDMTDESPFQLILKHFKPKSVGALVRKETEALEVEVKGGDFRFSCVANRLDSNPSAVLSNQPSSPQETNRQTGVYIPVKEMLSNAPGFRSLYAKREIAFEKVYADIIDKALLPPLKNGGASEFSSILETLRQALGGKIEQSDETFYLDTPEYKLEFMLLAEGLRKLGLLWLLIRNGSLAKGAVLCWDEPEANLNPRLMKTVVEILLRLQQLGVQIFLATHSYVLLKEFDLQSQSSDKIRFHALYNDDKIQSVQIESTNDYLQINPNAIADTFADLYDRDIDRALGKRGVRE